MPIYKMNGKKDGKQKYRVRINYTDSSGKSKQIDRVAYGKEEAKELERQLNCTLHEETVKRITVQDLVIEYIKAKNHEVRETTVDKSIKILNTFVLSQLGTYKLDRLTPAVMQNWKHYIEEQKTNQGQNFSLKYKKNIYGEFRTLLNYAVKMEYISKNPLLVVGTFKDVNLIKKDMDYYTASEFKKFILSARKNAVESERDTGSIYEWNYYTFFMIAFYTGMRKGEIYALKWSDISNQTINIKRSIAQKLKGGDRETPPKNKSSIRSIQIPIPLSQALNEHKERQKNITGYSDDWRICGGINCIRDSTLEKRNKLFADCAEIKHIRIHDFRHSHASLLINNGINIQEVARRLGHSRIEITWNTYSHLYPKEEEKAINILNKI